MQSIPVSFRFVTNWSCAEYSHSLRFTGTLTDQRQLNWSSEIYVAGILKDGLGNGAEMLGSYTLFKSPAYRRHQYYALLLTGQCADNASVGVTKTDVVCHLVLQ